jgi:hypothetical protein
MLVIKCKLKLFWKVSFVYCEKSVVINGEFVVFGVSIVGVDFHLLPPQNNVLRDVKDFVVKVLPEDGPHFHIVFLEFFRKALRLVQQFAVLL